MNLTSAQLKGIFLLTPQQILDTYAPLLNEILPKYHIDTPERVRCFLAQAGEESNGLVATKEYASGKQYEGNTALGNTREGDGVKFKGRGLMQITGCNNYTECSKALFDDLRLLDNPELLEQPQWALESACWYWNSRNLSHYADRDDAWRFTANHPEGAWDKLQWITILINGALSGYPQRFRFYQRAKTIIV